MTLTRSGVKRGLPRLSRHCDGKFTLPSLWCGDAAGEGCGRPEASRKKGATPPSPVREKRGRFSRWRKVSYGWGGEKFSGDGRLPDCRRKGWHPTQEKPPKEPSARWREKGVYGVLLLLLLLIIIFFLLLPPANLLLRLQEKGCWNAEPLPFLAAVFPPAGERCLLRPLPSIRGESFSPFAGERAA